MTDCDHYRELASAMVDGELDEDLAASTRDHLNICPPCGRAYLEMSACAGALRSAVSSVAAPDRLRSTLCDMLEANPPQKDRPVVRRRASWRLMWGPALAVSAVLLVVLTRIPTVPLEDLHTHDAPAAMNSFPSPHAAARHLEAATGVPVRPVSLQEMDLSFKGGGGTSCGSCPGAYMAFRDKAGRFLTVYELSTAGRPLPAGESVPLSGVQASRIKCSSGCDMVFWPQRGLLIVVCTDLPQEHAMRASSLVFRQIRSN